MKKNTGIKAVGLLSGGLDSTLAVKLMMDQGVEVHVLNLITPFCTCTRKGCTHEASRIAELFKLPVKIISAGKDYIEMIKNPKYGYGSNLNPCIDCRIFLFQKAKKYMDEVDAHFIVTGEGKEFRKKIEEVAIKSRLPKEGITSEPTKVEKNESYSIQFEIYKGIFFKVYRKTKEHLRAELTFKKDILKKKFKNKTLNWDGSVSIITSRDMKRIVKPVIEWSKEFFKKADMTTVFYHILNRKENVIVVNQLQPLHKFFQNSVPEMNVILDSVLNGLPVRDKQAITFLRRNRQYGKDFIREYDSNGNWYYDYNPIEAERRRINDVKNKHARPKITKATAPNLPRYIVWRGDKMFITKM